MPESCVIDVLIGLHVYVDDHALDPEPLHGYLGRDRAGRPT
jgi:hypothetical protein